MLAGYRALNGLAATLLATAGFFWYQIFGDLTATLIRHGPGGLAGLARPLRTPGTAEVRRARLAGPAG